MGDHGHARRRARGDDGQVGIGLALGVVATATVAMLALANVGRAVVDRTGARTAADAAALAGVAGGRGAAEELAAANGGVLEELRTIGSAVEVRVRVGTAQASSRAAPWDPGPAPTGSPPAP